MPTLPRDIPPFEQMRIGDKPLPSEMIKALQNEWERIYDLRDFVLNWFVDNETPAGTQDGVNKNFTLQFVPMPQESLKLFISRMKSGVGELLIFGVDYVLTGSSIVYQVAPSNTDFVRAYYRRRLTMPSVADTSQASQASSSTSPVGPAGGPGPGGGAGAGGDGILMVPGKFSIYDSPSFNAVF